MPQPTIQTYPNITLSNSTMVDGLRIKSLKDATRGTRRDVIAVDKDGLVTSSFDIIGSIADVQASITNLENINAETVISGDGTTPAIPAANLANWKANQVYNFNAQNTTANITLVDGTVVGTTTDPIEKGSTIQLVKTSTGYGYVLRDATDKSTGICVISSNITLVANTPFVYTHGLNDANPSSIMVYDSTGKVITNEVNFATTANTPNTVTVTSSLALTGVKIKVCTGVLGATVTLPATTNALSLTGSNLTSTVNGVVSNVVTLPSGGTGTTTNTASSAVNTLTSTVNGIAATAPIVNTNALSLTGSNLTSTVNGVVSNVVTLPSGSLVIPGGVNTNVQFNDSGTFGGQDNFSYDKLTNTITLAKPNNNTSAVKGQFKMAQTNSTGTSTYTTWQDEEDILKIQRTGDTTGNGDVYAIVDIISKLGGQESTLTNSVLSDAANPATVLHVDTYNDYYAQDRNYGTRLITRNILPANLPNFKNEVHIGGIRTTINSIYTIAGTNTISYDPQVLAYTPTAGEWLLFTGSVAFLAPDTHIVSINTITRVITLDKPTLVTMNGTGGVRVLIGFRENFRINNQNGNMGLGTYNTSDRLTLDSGVLNNSGLKFESFNSNTPSSIGKIIGVDASGKVITLANPNQAIAGTYSTPLASSTLGYDTISIVASGSTQTLPTAVGNLGKKITVKKVGAGTTTIATTSSQLVDGVTPIAMTNSNQINNYVSDGANWVLI